MSSLIGYSNLYRDSSATVTASEEDATNTKDKAYDWQSYTWWSNTTTADATLQAAFAAVQAADYCAIYGHDLDTVGATVTPQYSDDGVAWTNAATGKTPTDGGVILFTWTSSSHKWWRVKITGLTGTFNIAGVIIGAGLYPVQRLKVGYAPAALSHNYTFKTKTSKNNSPLMRSKQSEAAQDTILLANNTPAWVRTYWDVFISTHAYSYPFIWAWDYENFSDEALLAWTDEKIPTPVYSMTKYVDVSLNVWCQK